MGADELIADAPADRFAESAPPPAPDLRQDRARPQARSAPYQPASPAPPPRPALQDGDVDARAIARAAPDLAALRRALADFDGCGLKKTAKHLCFSRGADHARVMFIGEAPGREEDMSGTPFVGPAGRLLNRMMAAIGLDEASAHIANVVYWRPPGNRTPTLEETQACLPFIERQIELVNPEIVVILGGAAAKLLTGATDGVMKLRGKWFNLGDAQPRRALVTLHPAYLLRTPAAKRLAWRDLLLIEAALKGDV
ncbi:MAG: uracil-DNA glycosylase [Hyphomicrobiales bacterium]|nr:uracil-DNA glycosylase [Hyphomicrobiales bacterium]